MRHRHALLLTGLVAFLLSACSSAPGTETGAETPDRPNIVLILLDDLGFDDLSVHGNTLVETPTLDGLARESVQFASFSVTPVCATTRAALLTGRHHLRTGVSHVHGGKDYLDLGETLLPEALQQAGYATGMWGKWHSGTGDGYHPWQRGFEEAFVARLYQYFDNPGVTNGEPDPQAGWTPERLTDKAIDFVTRHRDRPFFAYLPYLTVHEPLDAPEDLIEKYRAKGLDGSLAVLYAMVDGLDGQVRRLLEALETLGLAEDTVVVFLSDNGPWVGTHTLTEEERRLRYVSGMRGHKGDIWENGVRSPLFVRWTGRLAPRVVDGPAHVTDLYPTILELAGATHTGERPLDGRSLTPRLEGEDDPETAPVFHYAHPGWISGERPWTPEGLPGEYAPVDKDALSFEEQALAVRRGRHKLLLNPLATDHEGERDVPHVVLVDLEEDPGERANRAQEEPERAAALLADLREWWDGIVAEETSFQPPAHPVGRDETEIRIKACAPARVEGGLTNSFRYVTGWREGARAEYLLRVDTPGEYEVSVGFLGEPPRDVVLAVEVTGKKGRLMVDGEGTVTPTRITLSPGPATLGLALESGADAAGARLESLVLRRR